MRCFITSRIDWKPNCPLVALYYFCIPAPYLVCHLLLCKPPTLPLTLKPLSERYLGQRVSPKMYR